MPASLKKRTVLVVGRDSSIARAITLAIREAGGKVVVAGRAKDTPTAAYDDSSIAVLAARLGHVDHVVSTASARA